MFFYVVCDEVIKDYVLYDVMPRTLPIKCGIWARSTAMAFRMHNTNTFMNYSPGWRMETLLNVIRPVNVCFPKYLGSDAGVLEESSAII